MAKPLNLQQCLPTLPTIQMTSFDHSLERWLRLWAEKPDLEFDKGGNTNSLIRHFLELGIATGSEVLFPLCGKAESMMSLAAHGYSITGIEISPIAIDRFFAEHHLPFRQEVKGTSRVYAAENLALQIYCDDLFKGFDLQCAGFFDFAALVAIRPEKRKQYVEALKLMLAPGAKGIVAILQYEGPALNAPYSMSSEEFIALFADRFTISEVEKYPARVHPSHALAARKLDGTIYAVEFN